MAPWEVPGGVTITYVHRGAPGDVVTISSDDIVLEKSFFVVGEKRIPYHRKKVSFGI